MARINRLDQRSPLDGENEMAGAWAALAQSSPLGTVYEKRLVDQWLEIGCAADGAPFVILGLIDRLDRLDGPQGTKLAGAFLDETRCAGARGLPDDAKARLKEIRDASSQDPSATIPSSSR
jgi:hypothetical protein